MTAETVVFTEHRAFPVNTRFGTKTKNIFTAQDGREFDVWKADLASQILATMSQPVGVEYDTKQNGEFTNREIRSVETNGVPPVTTPAQNVLAAVDNPQIKPVDRNAGLARAIETFGIAGTDPLANQQALFELADIYAAYGALNQKPVFEGPTVADLSNIQEGPTV